VLEIKEVLSSVLKSVLEYEMLIRNPMLAVQIPRRSSHNGIVCTRLAISS